MKREAFRRARQEIIHLAGRGLDWVSFSSQATNVIERVVPFQRSCWHTVDPGTVLFTGSLTRNVACSGTWLAEHEYVLDDVNKWWFLARSGRRAGATSLATHGDLSRSARHRSHASYGIGDELRGSLVVDGTYWGRRRSVARPARALVHARGGAVPRVAERTARRGPAARAPCGHQPSRGDRHRTWRGGVRRAWQGRVDLLRGGVLDPADGGSSATSVPAESKIVQAVAAQARRLRQGQDPLELSAA